MSLFAENRLARFANPELSRNEAEPVAHTDTKTRLDNLAKGLKTATQLPGNETPDEPVATNELLTKELQRTMNSAEALLKGRDGMSVNQLIDKQDVLVAALRRSVGRLNPTNSSQQVEDLIKGILDRTEDMSGYIRRRITEEREKQRKAA